MSSTSSSLHNHKADEYTKNANFVYSDEYTEPVFRLLNAQPGQRIIDLGCGTGQLTISIKQLVGADGVVWGIDSSEDMLNTARANNSDQSITYIQGDIQNLPHILDPSLKGSFDAVFSSATFHWCKANPGGVVDGIKWLLKPGGHVALEFGGFGNTVGIRAALHQVLRARGIDPLKKDPWYFPTIAQYETLLRAHGMRPHDLALVPRPTPLPTDIYGWLQTFARKTFFADLPDDEASTLMREVQELCRPDNYWSTGNPGIGVQSEDESGSSGWEIMYVRLRGVAFKNAE